MDSSVEEPVAAPPPAEVEAAPPAAEAVVQRRVGEIVWARSSGFSMWPGTVACPTSVRAARAARQRGVARRGARARQTARLVVVVV
jgi:hypothetical protein